MHAIELARLSAAIAKAGQDFERVAQQNVDDLVLAICDIDVFLLRISGEGEIKNRARSESLLRDKCLLDESTVWFEELDPIVDAVSCSILAEV